jgi:hypothetical protein
VEPSKPTPQRPPGGLAPAVELLLRSMGALFGVAAFAAVLVIGIAQQYPLLIVLSAVMAAWFGLRLFWVVRRTLRSIRTR